MANEIDFDRLVEWAEGRLSEQEARTVTNQLAAADEETRARAEWLRAFFRAKENTALVPPPNEVRRFLSRGFAEYAESLSGASAGTNTEEDREPGFFRRLVATLSFDSGLQPSLGGARSAGTQEERQLSFFVDVAEIVVNVLPQVGGFLSLEGQVFPSTDQAPDGFTVQILREEKEIGITTTGGLGEFAFEDLRPGTYEIVVSTGRVEISIPGIELTR